MPRQKGGTPWTKQQKLDYNKTYYDLNKKAVQAQRKNRIETTLEGRVYRLICNSRARSVEFDLTSDFIIELYNKQEGRCALTGEFMTVSPTSTRTTSNQISIDRINNLRSYTKDNVQLTTSVANMMRGKMTIEEFKAICKKVTDHG